MTVSVSVNWMRILRVAARLVTCGSIVLKSCRAANKSLPPGLACACAASGVRSSSRTAAIVLMVVSSRSRAELVGRVRDGPGRGDQVFQRNALVRCRPLFIDADIAGAVLHGRDAVGHQDVA